MDDQAPSTCYDCDEPHHTFTDAAGIAHAQQWACSHLAHAGTDGWTRVSAFLAFLLAQDDDTRDRVYHNGYNIIRDAFEAAHPYAGEVL
jgi:hypothetical protein